MSYDEKYPQEFRHSFPGGKIWGVSNDIEPELKYVVPNVTDLGLIYRHINNNAAKIGLTWLPKFYERSSYLLSLALNTVDRDNYPDFRIDRRGLNMRCRMDYNPIGKVFRRVDISIKEKFGHAPAGRRHEWEQAVETNGNQKPHALLSKESLTNLFARVSRHIRKPLAIDETSLRVESVVLASRLTSFGIMNVPGLNAKILVEFCNDAVLFLNPYLNQIIGYRIEFEAEGKAIASGKKVFKTNQKATEVIETTLSNLVPIIEKTPCQIRPSTRSKLGEAAMRTEAFYRVGPLQKACAPLARKIWPKGKSHRGRYEALMSNVKIEDVLYNNRLAVFAEFLPKSAELKPANLLAKPDTYRAQYPDFFNVI